MATMDQTPGTTVASLYVRPGGYDKIAAIVRGQFARMQADPQFSRFGTGRSIDSRRQAEQMTVIQLCALAGGPCYYGGRDMLTAHRGVGITEAEWMASLIMRGPHFRRTVSSIGNRKNSWLCSRGIETTS